MTDSTEDARLVTGGVDTHAEVHVAAAYDTKTTGLLATAAFPADRCGYQAMLEWFEAHGRIDQVGIEGTGMYGAGLFAHFRSAGVDVIDVDRPDRQQRERDGKTDTLDAQAAALAVIGGRATNRPKVAAGPTEAIRVTELVCHSAIKDRTRAINQFHSLVITAPAELREALAGRTLKQQLKTASRFRTVEDTVTHHTRQALKALARRIEFLDQQIDELETDMNTLAAHASPALLGTFGVGPHAAAQLLATVGANPDRFNSEAQFAKLCGVCPLPASSGKTNRHRLNRGGDRRANNALHQIVLVRLRYDPATKAYMARRTQQGRTHKEIVRCLKRFVAREIYQALVHPPTHIPTGHELRQLHTAKNLTITQTAIALGRTPNDISRLERGIAHNTTLANQQHEWLTQQPD